MSFVSINNVSKSFGDNTVLRNVDLTVEEHNVVCLIGASGSGKSTLLRCLNLLERVDEGEIVVDGQTITNGQVDVNALRRKIGIVFQAYNLFPHMTVLDNVMLGADEGTRRRPRGGAQDGDASCSAGSVSPTRHTNSRTGSRAGSSNASRSHGPSRCSRS